MNSAKLKSIMVLNRDTAGDLAEAIGVSSQRFSAKINEKDGAEFNQGEIMKIKVRYNLSPDEVDAIFFAKQVS